MRIRCSGDLSCGILRARAYSIGCFAESLTLQTRFVAAQLLSITWYHLFIMAAEDLNRLVTHHHVMLVLPMIPSVITGAVQGARKP